MKRNWLGISILGLKYFISTTDGNTLGHVASNGVQWGSVTLGWHRSLKKGSETTLRKMSLSLKCSNLVLWCF